MKFVFFFLPFLLFSLEINVDYFKYNKESEILTLYNNFPFSCKRTKDSVVCEFDKLPSTSVFKAKTKFFKFIPKFKKNKFILIIRLKTKNVWIFAKPDNLYNNPILSLKSLKKAKKWIIIANNEPLLSKRTPKGLDFYFYNSPKIFIGAVDDRGNPLNIDNEPEDAIKFFQILKKFKSGKDVSLDIDSFIKNYPNSVFIPDVLYMKMVLLFKNNNFEDVVEIGKKWIKKYSYDEKLPKVLLLMARAYSNMGFLSNASYLFNRIITEYPNTKEAYLAMIYLADQLYSMGDSKKAMKLYERVLFSTKNINIASLAAFRLAQRYMNSGEFKKAYEYYKKIYNANKEFLLKDKQKAFELAKMLASHKMYDLALDIAKDLLKRLKKYDDLKEPLTYYIALWSYKNKDYKEALKYIDLYLKKYPFGDYSDKMQDLRDKVLFNVKEGNLTKQLEYINQIIQKYKGSPIELKALAKKVRILYKLKKYAEILKLEDKIKTLPKDIFPDKKEFLQKIKKEYLIELLNKNRCEKAIELLKKYHITFDKKYDDKIYECAMKTYNFDIASIVCNKYLDSPDDKIFIKWMKRKIEALRGMKDYKDLIIAIDDLCGLYKNCHKYELYKFFALWNLKEYKKALKVAQKLEKVKDIKNADAFIKIVNLALQNNDKLLAATYAKKIINLQNYFKAYPYSPFVEFTYAQYSKNKKEATKVLKELLKRIKEEDKARALFMLANLTKDKKYINECLKVKGSKLWRGLCRDAENLF